MKKVRMLKSRKINGKMVERGQIIALAISVIKHLLREKIVELVDGMDIDVDEKEAVVEKVAEALEEKAAEAKSKREERKDARAEKKEEKAAEKPKRVRRTRKKKEE